MTVKTQTQAQPESKPAFEISPEAMRALSGKVREWSGWPHATLKFGKPVVSPFADCDHETHTFTANAEALILNPNRVLLTITPFRLRQEAVLTGALLHEAGHARHTLWIPRTPEEAKSRPLLHSDKTVPTKQALALARLMEEARIEGLMARDADKIGATGLGWTMRASAAHLVPTTHLHTSDPGQQIMDLITSWSLRAGRQYAIQQHTPNFRMRNWVNDFTSLLHKTLVAHLLLVNPTEDDDMDDDDDATIKAQQVVFLLLKMVRCSDDRGPTMLDTAREVLDILFPETDGDSDTAPMPSAGCESPEPEGEDDEEDTEPTEGSGSDDQPEDQPKESDEGEGASPSTDEDEGEGSGESEQESEGSGGSEAEAEAAAASDEGDSEGDSESNAANSALAEALAELEAAAKDQTEAEAQEQVASPPPTPNDEEGDVTAGGRGSDPEQTGGNWRAPTKAERETQKNAEKFLRDMISPTESSKVSLVDSPSSMVDGAAHAAWKASGSVRDPKFFVRTRREIEPSPPVKIAILVDVSASMEQLQKPSALLSWALASAALDLRNFAGRGQQVESTLIHWGDKAAVIQRNGAVLPGIREVPCDDGTYAMAGALRLVEQEIPGFFDITEKPVNRLLVQFTDWELFGIPSGVVDYVSRALEAGVTMLTIAPSAYSPRSSSLDRVLRGCLIQRGRQILVKYNRAFPEAVWGEAAKALAQ